MLRIEIDKNVAVLSLNRPPVNALNMQMVADLAQAARDLSEKSMASKVRCVVIRSQCQHFCAGADLKERKNSAVENVAVTVLKIQQAMTAIASIPVPVIAAINGAAIGGGLELALAADIRLAADDAKMGLRETALGIIPGAGGTQRLARLIGPAQALYWIASAKIFSAQEALSFGVVQKVDSTEKLLDAAMNLAFEIAANAPVALRAAKQAIFQGIEKPLKDGLALEHEFYKTTVDTADRVEALNAFFEKRMPRFNGN
ncbi:MAG: enoyl-CoA hydratase [Calditrichaeota bacterium]|nr:MAG: enoyl-CoA hydratase [Calditrichota bacterium]